jgi:hypothetical protein
MPTAIGNGILTTMSQTPEQQQWARIKPADGSFLPHR